MYSEKISADETEKGRHCACCWFTTWKRQAQCRSIFTIFFLFRKAFFSDYQEGPAESRENIRAPRKKQVNPGIVYVFTGFVHWRTPVLPYNIKADLFGGVSVSGCFIGKREIAPWKGYSVRRKPDRFRRKIRVWDIEINRPPGTVSESLQLFCILFPVSSWKKTFFRYNI